MEQTNPSEPIRYKDLYVRISASVIAAHIIVIFGEPDSTFEILLKSYYYPAFGISFVIAFLLISYVHWVTSFLDKRKDWEHHLFSRALLQVLLGFIAPAFLAFFQAWYYLKLRGINILKTTYVSHDFQYILLMLVILNAYYIGFYFFLRWKQAERRAALLKASLIKSPVDPKEQFLVSGGTKNVLIDYDAICFFYRQDESNLLRTFQDETYYISRPLDDVQQDLDRRFFRVNRQMIINRKALKNYKAIEFGKIQIELEPAPAEPAIVSQRRAKSFKEWMKSVS
ncbi:LytTR family DNA-binding domain-containing protein [Pedobacter frigoris]|uniref:LytTR family DNA-binding domain-containing protein n=1 Tax=Pedobacter frigoris TaxID=2571272 RepID=UPI00293056DC|nr:LytTR family DNA-binding domain-containing protein [Pedobacter frigoris]